jgi:hypothetical protein
MKYKPGKPNDDLSRAKPFWEEVPDRPPPKYEPPKSDIQPPFWEHVTSTMEKRSLSTSLVLFMLILLGVMSLWL